MVQADAQLAGPLRRGDHRVDTAHVPTGGLVEEPAQRPPSGHQLRRHTVALEQLGHHDTTRRRVAARVALAEPGARRLARVQTTAHRSRRVVAGGQTGQHRGVGVEQGRQPARPRLLAGHRGQHACCQGMLGGGGGPAPDLGAGRCALPVGRAEVLALRQPVGELADQRTLQPAVGEAVAHAVPPGLEHLGQRQGLVGLGPGEPPHVGQHHDLAADAHLDVLVLVEPGHQPGHHSGAPLGLVGRRARGDRPHRGGPRGVVHDQDVRQGCRRRPSRRRLRSRAAHRRAAPGAGGRCGRGLVGAGLEAGPPAEVARGILLGCGARGQASDGRRDAVGVLGAQQLEARPAHVGRLAAQQRLEGWRLGGSDVDAARKQRRGGLRTWRRRGIPDVREQRRAVGDGICGEAGHAHPATTGARPVVRGPEPRPGLRWRADDEQVGDGAGAELLLLGAEQSDTDGHHLAQAVQRGEQVGDLGLVEGWHLGVHVAVLVHLVVVHRQGEHSWVGVGQGRGEQLVAAPQAGGDDETGRGVPQVGVARPQQGRGRVEGREHVAERKGPQGEERLDRVGEAGDVGGRRRGREQPAHPGDHVEHQGLLAHVELLTGPHRHGTHGRGEADQPVLDDDAEHPQEGVGVREVDGLEHRLAQALLALGREEHALDHLPAGWVGRREQADDHLAAHAAHLVAPVGAGDQGVAHVGAAGRDGGREDRAQAEVGRPGVVDVGRPLGEPHHIAVGVAARAPQDLGEVSHPALGAGGRARGAVRTPVPAHLVGRRDAPLPPPLDRLGHRGAERGEQPGPPGGGHGVELRRQLRGVREHQPAVVAAHGVEEPHEGRGRGVPQAGDGAGTGRVRRPPRLQALVRLLTRQHALSPRPGRPGGPGAVGSRP